MHPLAEVELLLTEELRSFHPTDIRLGGVTFHGMRVHPLTGAPAGHDAYLVKVNYRSGPERPAPARWFPAPRRGSATSQVV
ncbi:hypothetical protein Acsp05_39170 [Actinokineospora sp. NBRC 105648]|nr:hypothetical protein Acsp05_39170 [Actinokineospora sp. NBRC 105648]